MSELVEEFFCSGLDEEKQGTHVNKCILKISFQNTTEMRYGQSGKSDRTEDSLSTDDRYVEKQFTDPVWCYSDDTTTDTENGPKTYDGDQYLAW